MWLADDHLSLIQQLVRSSELAIWGAAWSIHYASGPHPMSAGTSGRMVVGLAGLSHRSAEGEFSAQSSARPGRTVEDDLAAEGFHPVLESAQTGATAEVGAAATVVVRHLTV
jgi:hypothetical protein